MPATRSTLPPSLDERKRTRTKSENFETISKSKLRKIDDAELTSGKSLENAISNKKIKAPNAELKTQTEISKDEHKQTTEEPAAKRGRGRPRKVDTPVVAGQSSREVKEGDDREENRTDKHKDLIEVDKRGKRDSGNTQQKGDQQTYGSQKLGADSSDILIEEEQGHKKVSSPDRKKDLPETRGLKGSVESKSSADIKDRSGKGNHSDQTPSVPRKRGRKPKRAAVVTKANDSSDKDASLEYAVEEQGSRVGKYRPDQVVSSSDKTSAGDDSELGMVEKSAKKQTTDYCQDIADSKPSWKAAGVEDLMSKASEGDVMFSPRRSGRGTVPNSRYKDMHLFSTSKKQHQSPTGRTGIDIPKHNHNEHQSKDEIKSVKKKSVTEDSKPFLDAPRPSSSDTKGKEKAKLKPFSSGASMARAQAKAQQQAEAKGRAADKFSIREIARGLEVTGRDGIPVLVSPENIVRVPFPSKSQEENTKHVMNDSIKSNCQSQATETTSEPSCAHDSQTDKPQPDASSESSFKSLQAKSDVSEKEKEVLIAAVSQMSDKTPETYSQTSAPTTAIIEEVVETEVVLSAGTGDKDKPDSAPGVSSADGPTSQTTVASKIEGECTTDTPQEGSGSQAMEVVESGVLVHLPEEPEGKSSLLSPAQESSNVDTNSQLQSADGDDDGKMLMMAKLTGTGNAVVLVDKTKKLPHQFLKDTLSSMPPAKPGYIISSPRRNSSVVKIVTLSSMLEESKQEKKEPELTCAETKKASSCVSILQPESNPPLPVISDVESRPSGVDMILAGSKTVDAADAATAMMEEKLDEPEKKAVLNMEDSKFSSASTQTPIDRVAEKTIIPTIYKTSAAPPLKTISVNLGKHELQEGEVGYELPEPGVKPKSEEYILVELPEGATVQQRYIKSRTKIDDSMFLSSESMVQGIYHCTLCNYETSKKPNWYKHKKKHIGFREYECTQCEYRAATSSNLKRHLAIHQDVRAYSCPKCDLNFRQKIHLERHIKYKHEEKQIRCPFCEYMCANENPDLKVHIKRKHLPGHSPDGAINAFTCPDCKLVTVSRRDLKQHMKFHRKGPELKLFCEHCSFVTDCESRLRRHELIHTKEKPFQCGLCEYRGSQKEHVLRHMRSMHNIDVMRRKRKSVSGEDTPTDSNQIGLKDFSKLIDKTDYSTKDKIFACNHCTMKFSKLINLYKHLHTQHRNIMPSELDDDFACVVCDFRTNTKKNLLVHMRKHNMTDHSPPSHLYSCVLCRYTNAKRRNLFQHMRKKHHIEIVMKDDGSTSCFVTDTSNIQEDVDQNVLTVGDVVTTTTADTDSHDDPTGVHSVISLEDLATIVTPEPNHDGNLIIDTGQLHNITLSSLVQQHEAAEAIEGLQALAGQINLADSVIEEVQVMDDPGLDPITMETTVETSKDGGEEKPSIQLSAEHLLHLSSGDFVEINGEMYKVEITADDSAKATPATLTAMPDIGQP